MQIIGIIVGIVFVMLLFSLLATTIMELLAGLLALRGQNLRRALKHLLAHDGNETLFNKFEDSDFYKQLSGRRMLSKSYRPPSYISSDSFWSILSGTLFDKGDGGSSDVRGRIEFLNEKNEIGGYLRNILIRLLDEAEEEEGFDHKIRSLKATAETLENEQVRKTILTYAENTEERVNLFRGKVENWYNSVMDRTTGWYKRQTQAILFLLGLLIAVGFNADIISIYDQLAADPELALQIADQAEAFLQESETRSNTRINMDLNTTIQGQLGDLNGLIADDIASIKSPLGIGWGLVDVRAMQPFDWLSKILGWLVMALAVTLGAPFWFDMLKKLIHIRSSGVRP